MSPGQRNGPLRGSTWTREVPFEDRGETRDGPGLIRASAGSHAGPARDRDETTNGPSPGRVESWVSGRPSVTAEWPARDLDETFKGPARDVPGLASGSALRPPIGAWLAKSVSADSIEALVKLRAALESEQIQQHLRQQILASGSDMSEAGNHHDPVFGDIEGGDRDDLGQ